MNTYGSMTHGQINVQGQTGSDAKYNIYPDRDFDLNDAASTTELTGLFVRPPLTQDELESYQSIYDYVVRSGKKRNKEL